MLDELDATFCIQKMGCNSNIWIQKLENSKKRGLCYEHPAYSTNHPQSNERENALTVFPELVFPILG